jgi:hypothetical protein
MGGKKMSEQTDAEFEDKLRSYLAQFSEGQRPVVPLLLNDDGTINRKKTLGLVCYSGIGADGNQQPGR